MKYMVIGMAGRANFLVVSAPQASICRRPCIWVMWVLFYTYFEEKYLCPFWNEKRRIVVIIIYFVRVLRKIHLSAKLNSFFFCKNILTFICRSTSILIFLSQKIILNKNIFFTKINVYLLYKLNENPFTTQIEKRNVCTSDKL